MKKTILIAFLLTAIFFSSCTKNEFPPITTSSGNADFSKYISVGNSFTQGFQDGGLHNELGQQDNSYPAIISKQMGVIFSQPKVTGSGSGYMHLEFINKEIKVIKAFDPKAINNDPLAIGANTTFLTWADKTIAYNNLGIGGINVRNVLARNFVEANEYHVYLGGGATAPLAWNGVLGEPINSFGRFLEWGDFGSTIEYIEHIKNSQATFFTNWLGINDAMSWAKEGGDDLSGFSVLTNVDEFRLKYDSVLAVFKSMGAKGVCATVHDITQSPFFNTVTLDAVGTDIWIKEGADTTVIRKATVEDLILLSAASLLADSIGLTIEKPLPHTEVLDKNEATIVKNYINDINIQIKESATEHNYFVVDMFSFMNQLNSGITFDGINFSAKYIEGGAYSLDGLHPNSRGYAMVANEFIKTINANYKSNLQTVSVSEYRGITFP